MTRSSMGAAITPEDFSSSLVDHNRRRWTMGKMRHVVTAAADHRCLVVIDGLAHVDVELVAVRESHDGPGGRLVTRYRYGTGERDHNDTGYRLEEVGTVVDLQDTRTKHEAIESYRNEVAAAIQYVRQVHGEAEGRAWGRWTGEVTQYGAVVRYEPATGNPHYADHWGTKGFWKPNRDQYAHLIRPTSAERRKAEQLADLLGLLEPTGTLTGTGAYGDPVTE